MTGGGSGHLPLFKATSDEGCAQASPSATSSPPRRSVRGRSQGGRWRRGACSSSTETAAATSSRYDLAVDLLRTRQDRDAHRARLRRRGLSAERARIAGHRGHLLRLQGRGRVPPGEDSLDESPPSPEGRHQHGHDERRPGGDSPHSRSPSFELPDGEMKRRHHSEPGIHRGPPEPPADVDRILDSVIPTTC